MLALLALLLERLSSSSADGSGRRDGALQAGHATEQRIITEPGESALHVEASAVLAEDGIGVLDVGARESLDRILESCETSNNLYITVRIFSGLLKNEIVVI